MTDHQHDVFDAIADPMRRSMIEKLSEQGEMTATQLARILPITRQGVSKHLNILASAGLVETRKSGRERQYALTPGALANATTWVDRVNAAWDRRLQALSAFLAGAKDESDHTR